MDKENTNKSEHGMNGISSLDQMVDSLASMDYIISYEKDYRIADPNYGDKQFYFQFLIEFSNNEQWILHHTTSIRDRINQQQWHSEHIKRLNNQVSKAYVVVPDGLSDKEKKAAESYNRKIQENRIYSALDGVYTFSKMYQTIEHKAASMMEFGRAKAKLGLSFENKLVECLNNPQNFERWRNNTSLNVGYLYTLYCDVMNKFCISPKDVISVHASSNIPKLPSGGSPKTDVIAVIETSSGESDFTISCKRSKADRVSIHEYTAETFAKTLNPDDAELLELLLDFQSAGGIKAMSIEKSTQLENKMKYYRDKLVRWALAGIGGEGKPKIQWATHIITVNDETNEYTINSIDEFINKLYSLDIKGQFGTPFQWTYPSGGRGKRIQLKCKII